MSGLTEDIANSGDARRSLHFILEHQSICSTVLRRSERARIQAVHLTEQIINGTADLSTGADHHITLDLSGTDYVCWKKSGRRNFVGSSPVNSVTIIPAYEDSTWSFTKSSNKLHVFVPDRILRSRIDALGQDGTRAELRDVFACDDPTFTLLLRAVYHELTVHGGDTLLQETLHEAVYDILISHYVDGVAHKALSRERARQKKAPPILDPRIVRAIDYVETYLGAALSIDELALNACLSPGHFTRVFKATTGETVWTYVQRRRCERAKDLLLHSREALSEIALKAGFADQSHMTKCLRERFGATPGAIRSSGS